MRRLAIILLLIAAVGFTAGLQTVTGLNETQAAGVLSVRIVGNHFVDGTGRTVRLLGVNRSGTEDECMASNGFFDGPTDAGAIAAMASWNIDAVRIPLNEDCWLGINGAPAAYSGTRYHQAIAGYVARLHAAGMYAIVDLHWNAQGSLPADGKTGQGRKMADLDHSPAYWASVASFFKNDLGVVFDLFNEPHDISWDCWLHGCSVTDGTGSWQAAGMQTLLDAVRGTGARNVVTLSADGWGGDIPQWINYRPHDPIGQIAAGWHVYYPETWWSDPSRWNQGVAPLLAARIPIVVTEFGEHDCGSGWLKQFLPWADQHGFSYTAWTWNTWPDCGNPVLITNYNGTPTGYGLGLRDHLQGIGGFHPAYGALAKTAPPAARATAVPATSASPSVKATARAISRRRAGAFTPISAIATATPRAATYPLLPVIIAILLLVAVQVIAVLLMRRRRRRVRVTAAEPAAEEIRT